MRVRVGNTASMLAKVHVVPCSGFDEGVLHHVCSMATCVDGVQACSVVRGDAREGDGVHVMRNVNIAASTGGAVLNLLIGFRRNVAEDEALLALSQAVRLSLGEIELCWQHFTSDVL